MAGYGPTICHGRLWAKHLSWQAMGQPIVRAGYGPTICHGRLWVNQLSWQAMGQPFVMAGYGPTICHGRLWANHLSWQAMGQPIVITGYGQPIVMAGYGPTICHGRLWANQLSWQAKTLVHRKSLFLLLAVETATLSRLLSKLSPHLVRLDFLDIVFRNGIEACCQATSSNAHKASFLLSQLYTTLQRCDALGSTDNTQVCPVSCYGNQTWC